jgi:radical SAM enzyme (TIGR01210 family)
MTALDPIVRDIRQAAMKKARGGARVVSWSEKDFLDGPADAGVVILPTRGCAWGRRAGCSMCGYVYDSGEVAPREILEGFRAALEKIGDVDYLKIFNSGSFFDPREITEEVEQEIISIVNETPTIKRLQVESRPEFMHEERLERARSRLDCDLEVGIGLETTSDYIRANCINKGFTLEDFKRSASACKASDVLVKAYLLIKPPFLTEEEALKDMVASAVGAQGLGASRISFNPMNVQRGTLVDHLFHRREYRPPWLWTVLEILRQTKTEVDVPVLCHPTAAGKKRGAHNCGECDSGIAGGIRDFSVSQDAKHLEGHECQCKATWKAALELEGFNQSPDGTLFR